MFIQKVYIKNFKSLEGEFNLELTDGLNIIVGDNEAGKSTILEAIHLALTGIYRGRYLRYELSEYLFNNNVVTEYIRGLEENSKAGELPEIAIEIFFSEENSESAMFLGNGNSNKAEASGIGLKIEFDDAYKEEYEALVKDGGIKTLPIEYYKAYWVTFARDENITPRRIPIKTALIDSSRHSNKSGSDLYFSKIMKDALDTSQIIDVSQAYRRMKEVFMGDESIKSINEKIKETSKVIDNNIELSVELSTKDSWESIIMTYIDDIPFHYVGNGLQSILKTKLALGDFKHKDSTVLLIEEPENHLSFSNLNMLINDVVKENEDKQIIISTHSSFVANKLGLENIILLSNKKTIRFNDLSEDTLLFFKKLSGYDTLRIILSKGVILVEGDSDELIVQKAFMKEFDNKLPIEERIDVISVGTSFLRFLEIANKLGIKTAVVTDTDGNLDSLESKYIDYIGSNKKNSILICYDEEIDSGDKEGFNYNTLEPKLLKVNSVETLNNIFNKENTSEDSLLTYMKNNKTTCALKIFDTDDNFNFPKYILDAVKFFK